MRSANLLLPFVLCCSNATRGLAQPTASRPPASIQAPRDHPFHGAVQLHVDATDVDHGVFHVREQLPLQGAGDTVLLYPEWETTSHAPTASAVELAGLEVEIDGQPVAWHRDAANVHAFHVVVPQHAKMLSLVFDYLSPRSAAELRPQMVNVQWQRVLLYPAGWYARNIPVKASLKLPAGLRVFTSLTRIQGAESPAGLTTFAPETLDRLIDAPVYAARYARQLELSALPEVPVHLDLVADAPDSMNISTTDLAGLQALIEQTGKVFGPPPFRHYDALVVLSDQFSAGGLEHLDEGENDLPAAFFSARAEQLNNLDLIAHEYVHAWNGRFRQPDGLWSPNFNLPIDPSLLWVYEGQTEFWGRVLAARAGIRTPQQTLDKLALDADHTANRTGRAWKSLADSTLDVLYMPGHAVAWRDWQRREDYYPEGVLLWLDVDARLRELSHEKYSLDDFAHAFFATHGEKETPSTYSFDDLCRALTLLVPADWKGFLNQHLLTHDTGEVMGGLARAGWRLTYSAIPTETFLQDEAEAGVTDLDTSLGAQFRANGGVRSVMWNGPAFRAGLSPGTQIVAVNGEAFARATMLKAVSTSASIPLRLTVQDGETRREVTIPYSGPLRYPHLERLADTPDRLTRLLTTR